MDLSSKTNFFATEFSDNHNLNLGMFSACDNGICDQDCASTLKKFGSFEKSAFALPRFELKVGSCLNDDDSVQNLFLAFSAWHSKYFYFLNLLLPRKLPNYAEKFCLSFINFLCRNNALEFL